MLAFGNKEFRNLQEQVLENMRQIDDIKQAAVVLDEFGIKVIGQIESADELPDPETYEGDFGDAYAVGTEAPYELYIWTRGDSLGNNAYWFDIGAFPQAGPQGEQGPRGEQGPSGTIAFGSMSVTTTEPGTNANVSFTNIGTASNAVYNLSWYIPRGAQGIPGETGATGATGATGPQGPKGDKGDTGTGYIIMGQLDSELDLPDPGSTDRQAAYLVGAHEPYNLYVIVGLPGHLEWFDAGSFTTAKADISEFDAGTGLTLDEVDDKITYSVDTNTIATHTDVAVAINSLSSSIASTYATKASLSSFQSDVNSAFSSVYASISNVNAKFSEYAELSASVNTLTGDLEVGMDLTLVGYLKQPVSGGYINTFELPSESGQLALVSDIPDLYGYATESYVNTEIGKLDYASVGALSSGTVIPDTTGLASVSYVNDSIAALSSVYASISAIPDMSEYATVSQVSSAISALDYASVGALSANTVIPDITGLASETYVNNAVNALSSIYATQSVVATMNYASVGALSANTVIPDITGLASEAYVNSAVSALSSVYAYASDVANMNYASVGALSAATVIPDITGLASEEYVNSSISALSSVYAPIGNYANLSTSNTFTGSNIFTNTIRLDNNNHTGTVNFGSSPSAYCNISGSASGIMNPYFTIRVGNTFTNKSAYYDFGVSSATMNGTNFALITDIPSLSEYATTSQLSSAISDLSSVYAYASNVANMNYASVGALSSGTVIPVIPASLPANGGTASSISGYASEVWTFTLSDNTSVNKTILVG